MARPLESHEGGGTFEDGHDGVMGTVVTDALGPLADKEMVTGSHCWFGRTCTFGSHQGIGGGMELAIKSKVVIVMVAEPVVRVVMG